MVRYLQWLTAMLLSLGVATAAVGATVSVDNGGQSFGPGSTLRLAAGVAHSGAPVAVDAYLLVVLPDGSRVFFQPTASGIAPFPATADPATWKKLASNWQVPAGLDSGLLPLVQFAFSGNEPAGIYTSAVALTKAGTLDILDLKTAPFFVSRYPLVDAFGTFKGTWNNLTFGSTGPVTFQVSDASPGRTTMLVTLGGNVFGGIAPPPFTVNGAVNTEGTLVTLSGGSTLFGTVAGTIKATGEFDFAITNIPGGMLNSATFTGTYLGGAINLAYKINFSAGTVANGTLTATRQ